ncbi:MAG TPA: biotin--[acetyl-CoA-carboxylase] ligase [Streptosporangiaceae bacterium]|nr:biotin--[acetyl-CoA-carboxylase] ligase [Streptosporangiaceae bacterium]
MRAGHVDFDPPPLVAADLAHALVRPGRLWRDVQVVAATGSTNTDLLRAAAAGAPEGTVLAAEEQAAGRGRMGRSWLSPPRAALAFSVLVRPAGVPASHRGWLPLLAGVAAASALRQVTAVRAMLKWPNDVLVEGRKLAGILAEQTGDAIVVGIGVNVSAVPPGPAGAAATSVCAESGAPVSRAALLVAVLGEFEHAYLRWTADPAGPWLARQYQSSCDTIGRDVRVELPGGRALAGTAAGIDGYGRLVVRAGDSLTAVSAGDVVHVR